MRAHRMQRSWREALSSQLRRRGTTCGRSARQAAALGAAGGAGAFAVVSSRPQCASCSGAPAIRDLGSFATTAIHTGQEPDPQTGAVTPPIVLSTTFAQPSLTEPAGAGVASSFGKGFAYARGGNPTRGQLEICLAACEGGRHCAAFGSGMAAIAAVVSALLRPGDRCIVVDDAYGGTQRLLRHATVHMGIHFDLVDVCDPERLEEALCAPGGARLVWVESPTNPTLKICDIRAVAAAARRHGCLTVVDNTFASPVLQNPLALGADVVVHSLTKYIGGHSDVMGGAVVVDSDELAREIRHVQNSYGGVPGPLDAYLAARGLKTLHVRMAEHQRNAQAVAEFLEGHAAVARVIYPGLASHPQHDLAARQMRGFGGMVTLYLRGGLPEAQAFLSALRVFAVAESLGAVESLAESPAVMTHQSVPAAARAAAGISDGLIRLSVGLEAAEDLLADLDGALAAAATAHARSSGS
mmetsp:Transcript_121483/g.378114  ORF Transcript_121483/g.378114 Transcript_121483/m.378114 type:complete len:469 (-) Transcript_121483:57-1463(-)